MEKIKQIISGNKSNDDNNTTSTSTTSHNTHGGLSGEGSHLGNTGTTASSGRGDLKNTSSVSGTTAGEGSHLAQSTGKSGLPAGNTTDSGVGAHSSGLGHSSGLTGNNTSSSFGGDSSGLGQSTGSSGMTGNTSSGIGGEHRSGLTGNTSYGQTSGLTTGQTGVHGGPHQTELANVIDPNLNSSHTGTTGTGASQYGHKTTTGPHGSSALNKADPRVDSDRDGSRAVGGATSTSTGLGGNSGVGHSSTSQNPYSSIPVDPRIDSAGSTSHSRTGRDTTFGGVGGVGEHGHRKHDHDNTSHTGRNAALGGAGAAGVAEHEHRKHEHDPTGSTSHSHTGRDAALGVGAGGVGDHGHKKHDYDNTSHTGRNAALGGAGAAGVAEHEHRKHEHENATDSKTDHSKHSVHNSKHTRGEDYTTTTRGHNDGTTNRAVSDLPGPAPNTAGPHKKDWMNKLDPRVDQKGTKDIDSNSAGEDTTTGKPHHKGPVVLGGPAVGATTHEAAADKHGLGTSHDSNLHTGTDSGPLGSGHHGTTSTSHTGRDAALGVGAAGAAEHEHNKSKHDSSSLTEKPVGTDTGDKLHGVERNRGVQGHSSTVGDSGHHIGGSQNSSHVGHGHTTGAGEHSSHTGRDAAVLGGAAYEGQKHEPSTHHIGGETSSHVGHGHSGHHDRAGLTDRSAQSGLGHQGTNQDGFAGNSQTGTGLTGSNDSTNLSRDNTTEHSGEHKGFDSEARRGTTSGLHTNPAIHHVPAVGKHHQN